MGELHLDIIVDRMKREFNVEANVGKPQVAYRETIQAADVKSDYKHAKQSGGKGQYGHVVIELSPITAEDRADPKIGPLIKDDFLFINDITGGVIPKEFIPSIEKGLRETITSGPLAGFPVVDVKVKLSSAPTMTSTPRKWRSSWRPRWPSSRASPRPSRSCWSRS